MGKWAKIGCLGLVLVVVGTLIGGLIFTTTQIPDVPSQLADSLPRTIISINKPSNNSHWYLPAPITIAADVVSSTTNGSLELWVDDALVESRNAASGSAVWHWTIKTEGMHVLVVRARDTQGRLTTSNAVRVVGTRNPNPGFVTVYSAKTGDTVASIAANSKIAPQKILDLNPKLDLNSPLPNTSPVKIPISPPALPSSALSSDSNNSPLTNLQTQLPSFTPINSVTFWIGKFFNQTVPDAPGLMLQTSQCTISALITDNSNNEDGFNLYRLDPNSQTYKRIATFSANSNTTLPIKYDDSNLFGTFSYYVSSFNALGETPGKIFNATITTPSCQTPFWIGQLTLYPNTSLPLIPFQPNLVAKYDKAYFYLEINNQPWGRVPQDPNQFLALKDGILNIDEQIQARIPPPVQGDATLNIDAWGWQNGKLVHIGKFTRKMSASKNIDLVNPKLEICSDSAAQSQPNCNNLYQTKHTQFTDWTTVSFRWSAPPETYGIYQVWSFPLPETNDCPVNVPGIVTSGLIGEQSGSNTFKIDFSKWKPTSGFAIRVIALNHQGKQICEQSNTVTIGFIPPPPPPSAPAVMPDPYDIHIASIDPIQFPDPQWAYCVTITKNDYYQSVPNTSERVAQLYQDMVVQGVDPNIAYLRAPWIPLPVGSRVCPNSYQPPADPCEDTFSLSCAWATFKATGEQFITAINNASQGYQSAKTWLVENVASIIPGCDNSTCKQVLSASLNAGLAALGVPPSLPNFDQIKQKGQVYIAEQMLEELGVSCTNPSDPCNSLVQLGHDEAKKLIIQGLDVMFEQLAASQSNSSCTSVEESHARGYEQLCFPYEDAAYIATVPVSESVGQPAMITLNIMRKTSVPDSALPSAFSCSFKIESSAKNGSWVGQPVLLGGTVPWTGKELTDEQADQAGLFKSVEGKIPRNLAGSQLTLPLMLMPNSATYYAGGNPYAGYWISEHWNFNYYDCQSQCYNTPDDWMLLYRGADAKFTVTESCTSPSTPGFQNVTKAQSNIHIDK